MTEREKSLEAQIQACLKAKEYFNAHELIARAYLDAVFRYCLHMFHGEIADAEDITQEIFKTVCTELPKLRKDGSVKAWLFTMAKNECLTELGKRQFHHKTDSEHSYDIQSQAHLEPSQNPEVVLQTQQRLHRVKKALDQLSPEEKTLILLRFNQGLSINEIVEGTGRSRAAVHRRLKTILDEIRGGVVNETQ